MAWHGLQKIAENPVAAPWSLRHVDQSTITAHSVLSCFGRLARNRERGCVHLDRPHLMTRHGMLAYCGRPTPDKTTLCEAAAVSAMCISLNSLANAAPGNLAKITFGLAYYLSHKPYRKLPRLT